MKQNIKSHALTFFLAAAVAAGLYALGSSISYYLQDDPPLKPSIIETHITQGGECVAFEIQKAKQSGLALNSRVINRANQRCNQSNDA